MRILWITAAVIIKNAPGYLNYRQVKDHTKKEQTAGIEAQFSECK